MLLFKLGVRNPERGSRVQGLPDTFARTSFARIGLPLGLGRPFGLNGSGFKPPSLIIRERPLDRLGDLLHPRERVPPDKAYYADPERVSL